jgi:rhomboid family protein
VKDDIPNDRFPFVTVALILANVVIYALAVAHGGSPISGPDLHELSRYGLTPDAITHASRPVRPPPATAPPLETVFSSMFLHASVLHLAANLLFLWIFGNTIENAIGPVRFLAFYLLGGLAAAGLTIALAPASDAPAVGASGAIAAVIAGYALIYPRAHVLAPVFAPLLFTVVEIPALVLVAVWVALQIVFAATDLADPSGTGGVAAYLAPFGGSALGLLAIRPLARDRGLQPAA